MAVNKPPALFTQATSALDHINHLATSGGSPYYPFTSVDAGWFIPDGGLADIITKGTVTWNELTHDNQLRLELYTQLHTLELCTVPLSDDPEYEDLQDDFAAIALKINALPPLRELHFSSKMGDEDYPNLNFPVLVLPQLTQLVIMKGYFLRSFENLEHLGNLQQLAVTLYTHPWETPKYGLDHLAPLKNLCDLEVSHLDIRNRQNVEALTALTSLRLRELKGYDIKFHGQDGHLMSFILPTTPMPKLRELYLVFSMGYFADFLGCAKQSDGVIDYILRTGATLFPAIETMQLGVLEFPAELDTEFFTAYHAAHLMDNRVHHLLAGAANLKHLSVAQARVQDEGLVDAAIESGDLLDALHEEVVVKTGPYVPSLRSVKWQREVDFGFFSTKHVSGVDAHFEYTRM